MSALEHAAEQEGFIIYEYRQPDVFGRTASLFIKRTSQGAFNLSLTWLESQLGTSGPGIVIFISDPKHASDRERIVQMKRLEDRFQEILAEALGSDKVRVTVDGPRFTFIM
jgi:hypothetical protein